VSIEDKDRDDVMERLLELGGDKKYLTFDDLNRELPDNVVSPDDIEDVLQKLEARTFPSPIRTSACSNRPPQRFRRRRRSLDEDIELDLSAARSKRPTIPVRSICARWASCRC
jgi:hypothetical protein